MVQDAATHCPTTHVTPLLLLILSELAEGGRKQSEPFQKVRQKSSSLALLAAQKESYPLLGSKGLWSERGGQGPEGGGKVISG